MPTQEKATGKWGQSLTFTVDANEARDEDGGATVVQHEPKQAGQLKLDVAAATGATMDKSMQVTENSVPVAPMNETDSAGKMEIAESVLLCVAGFLNEFPVKFLIDSGATDCFVSATFVEEKGLLLNKRKEKVKINLADGTMRVSNMYLKQACVSFKKHTEFIDFIVIKLPRYEAILGKTWLDKWNPVIDWKNNTMEWQIGRFL